MGTNLAENFYRFISSVPMRRWFEYVRILGLPETDIDEICYEDEDPAEQKYQMLSRWKSYYGYNKDTGDIVECLQHALRELLNNEPPEFLNRKLQGRLNENRQVARTLYRIMRHITPDRRKFFALTKLCIPETEADAILYNHAKDFDEQCYQMFLVWMRRSRVSAHADVRDKMERYLAEFGRDNPMSARASNVEGPVSAPSVDSSYNFSHAAGAHAQRNPRVYAAPSGDQEGI